MNWLLRVGDIVGVVAYLISSRHRQPACRKHVALD
jgi:hypothetical protein